MASESDASSRRRAVRKINYNEKDADADLVKRIQLMEKTRESATSSNKAKVSKTKYQSYLSSKSVCWNFIPSLPPSFRKHSRFSNILDLEGAFIDVTTDTLSQDGSALLKRNDHIYMVSEPPGEPYYIGRIVKFVAKPEFRNYIEDSLEFVNTFPAKFFQVKMNWYYRPRDVQDKIQNLNPRLLYASLHMDVCPIYSYRGKCNVVHRSTLALSDESQLEQVWKPNTFYFEQLFDRYTLRYYDIWSTRKQLLDLHPSSVYLISLANMYPFVFTEECFPLQKIIKKYVLGEETPDRATWDYKCGECGGWCEKTQRIKCDECHVYVHLFCLDPPLERKPIKGVIWICSRCLHHNKESASLTEAHCQTLEFQTLQSKPGQKYTLENSPSNPENLWFHYLGSKAVDFMDDILSPQLVLPFPLKNSRIGPRFQWTGSDKEMEKGELHHESEDERGGDKTSELLWKFDSSKINDRDLNDYIHKCQKTFPPQLDVLAQTSNFLDMILRLLMNCNYNTNKAFTLCENQLSRETLQEPTFTKEEIQKFEEGVAEYGSELHPVCKHVGTQPMSMIVRFYYYWKKTPNGKRIWGSYKGRKKNQKKNNSASEHAASNFGKKSRVRKPSKTLREDASSSSKEWKHIDDSSFDSEKISNVKTCFKCMFCEIDYSPLWYRVTGGCDDENIDSRMLTGVDEKTTTSSKLPHHSLKSKKSGENPSLEALCIRCARLWRRYAVKWINPLDVIRRLNGKYASSIRNALDQLLADPADTAIKVPPNQLMEKCVEWELAQDAELILKQRFNMLDNTERYLKMKRNCVSMHTQLNKAVKKLVDKDPYADSKMQDELRDYVNSILQDIRKKEKKAKAIKNKTKVTRPKESHTVIQSTKDEPKLKNAPDAAAGKDSNTTSVTSKSEKSVEVKQEQVLTKLSHNLPTGGRKLEVLINSGRSKIGEITVDSNFENLKLSEELYTYLLDLSSESANLQDFEQCDIDSITKTDSHVAEEGKKQYDPTCLQITNGSNVPILSGNDFSRILETYHSHNPLHSEWSQGTLPKVTNEFIQNVIRGVRPVTQNNMGRKARSSAVAVADSEFEGNSAPRNFCCVCLETFSPENDEEITCSNCGLNVHFFCYGFKPKTYDNVTKEKSKLKNLQWLCDICSNDLNPICSTNYQCSLCNAKESDYDGGKKRLSRSIPDALKITSNNTWCHVSCSLFNPNLSYSSLSRLQVAGNINSTLIKCGGKTCAICETSGGGLVACEYCDFSCHVTCAQDYQECSILFKKQLVGDDVQFGNVVKDKGQNFVIKPIILCPEHQSRTKDTTVLTYRTEKGVSLLENYCNNYKSPEEMRSGTVKFRAVDNRGEMATIKISGTPLLRGSQASNSFSKLACANCNKTSSIFWYGNICHACHHHLSDSPSNLLLNEATLTNEKMAVNTMLMDSLLKDIERVKPGVSLGKHRVKRQNGSPASQGRKKLKAATLEAETQPSGKTPLAMPVVVQNLSGKNIGM
ncbi:LAQU0S08e03664g1_1 [Lachancea quebecensis]|uniref:LAQU0S08e03664g1_1 n=1 Tax=Lachancea quebecensis TaxID=1654605 RepID=A0A0P1KVC5_9SACH|nr:LAQU0S08e03664g1_1 [Lachancea quebecensis]